MPCLKGSPGIGKSQLAQQIANHFGLILIDVRLAECDPCEIGVFLTLMKKQEKHPTILLALSRPKGISFPERLQRLFITFR